MSIQINNTFLNTSTTLFNNMLDEAISSTHAPFLPCLHDPSRVAQLPKDCLNYTSSDYYAYEDDDESMQLQQVVRIVVPTFFGIIGLSGLLGNALVVLGESLYILYTARHIKKSLWYIKPSVPLIIAR